MGELLITLLDYNRINYIKKRLPDADKAAASANLGNTPAD